ncbi:hypothetical protein FRC17_008323 [Serendipita sp. 399]|nr:hypothetical protein FRC17_008323 [Serendipita sp. 399]
MPPTSSNDPLFVESSAVVRASAEIWASILEHAIQLPDGFTDPDIVAEEYYAQKWPLSHVKEESEYWKTEHAKHALRMVCWSWNELLKSDRYSHRFVSMLDVHYGYVPADTLKRAERVSFKPAARGTPRGGIASSEDWVARCMEILKEVGTPTPMRIATDIPSIAFEQFWHELTAYAPSLVTVTFPRGTSSAFLSPSSLESFPNLRHLHATPSAVQLYAAPGAFGEAKHLVSLSIGCGIDPHLPISSLPQQWSFPALQTLRVWPMDDPDPNVRLQRLMAVVRALGTNVSTLDLPMHEVQRMPVELWAVCPRVERLFSWLKVMDAPPPDHPIHTVGVPFVRVADLGYDDMLDYPHFPSFSGLRTVRIDSGRAWDKAHEANYLFDHIRRYHQLGVRLEDENGLTYLEWMEEASN